MTFYAEVNGPSDSLSHWEVLPSTLGSIDPGGLFTAGTARGGAGKITAFNIEEPTLSNSIDIEGI